MKILMINVVCGIRSTGRICTDLATALEEQGHEVKIAYGRESVPEQFQKYAVRIGTDIDIKLHGIKARLLDEMGFGSKRATIKFIEWVKEYNPDVIHLHNIHGYYINVNILFEYLKMCGKKIIWTMHDCWAITGHCAYFTYANCEKWKTMCNDCPCKKDYPKSVMLDKSTSNYQVKKKLFNNVNNLTIVTPSQWLKRILNQSFLQQYPVRVINNGIDTSIFRDTKGNEIRKKLGIQDKKIILGVAGQWTKRKGLQDFIELSKRITNEYVIVLVGIEHRPDMTDKIVCIESTNNINELADIYSSADIYFNPTYEDNYPTTNLEARACGTPVITYNTGGSPESAGQNATVCKAGDIETVIKSVYNTCEKEKNTQYDLLSKEHMVEQYLKMYERGKIC